MSCSPAGETSAGRRQPLCPSNSHTIKAEEGFFSIPYRREATRLALTSEGGRRDVMDIGEDGERPSDRSSKKQAKGRARTYRCVRTCAVSAWTPHQILLCPRSLSWTQCKQSGRLG